MVFKRLKIKKDEIEGKGKDKDGKFEIDGKAIGTHVKFTKKYKHSISIIFEGQYNPAGQITGQWNISNFGSGTFYIN